MAPSWRRLAEMRPLKCYMQCDCCFVVERAIARGAASRCRAGAPSGPPSRRSSRRCSRCRAAATRAPRGARAPARTAPAAARGAPRSISALLRRFSAPGLRTPLGGRAGTGQKRPAAWGASRLVLRHLNPSGTDRAVTGAPERYLLRQPAAPEKRAPSQPSAQRGVSSLHVENPLKMSVSCCKMATLPALPPTTTNDELPAPKTSKETTNGQRVVLAITRPWA